MSRATRGYRFPSGDHELSTGPELPAITSVRAGAGGRQARALTRGCAPGARSTGGCVPGRVDEFGAVGMVVAVRSGVQIQIPVESTVHGHDWRRPELQQRYRGDDEAGGVLGSRGTVGEPQLVVNDEVADFCWWDPHSPPRDTMSQIDTEIARRVTS
ncbi:MAG TPA: hypothetical protein VHH34_15595 [Pseudonocardiaceae bacterium]|nr:hypothetical protein [Pseudonocardiaceae bacterium]